MILKLTAAGKIKMRSTYLLTRFQLTSSQSTKKCLKFTSLFENRFCDTYNEEFPAPAVMEKISKHTGKSLSEALIFESTNPQYDDRLFMKIVSLKYLQNMLCTQIVVFVLF